MAVDAGIREAAQRVFRFRYRTEPGNSIRLDFFHHDESTRV
jgi:hypothetical protein